VIKVHVLRLNPRHYCPEQCVPELCLLPVIAALSVSLTMVQVVIFDDQFTAHKSQRERRKSRRNRIHAQSRVPHNLREQNKRLADPPVVERHRQPEAEPHGKVREQRDEDDLSELLLDIREARQDRDGMLGGVVRFVVPPERADFVAGAVVGVEPEVEDDGVQQELEWEPRADAGKLPVVDEAGYEDEGQGAEDGEEGDGEERSGETVVRDWVAGVVVAVEEADSVGRVLMACSSRARGKSACTYFAPRLMSTVPALTVILTCAAMKSSKVHANGRLSPSCNREYASCTRQGQRACERVKTLQDQWLKTGTGSCFANFGDAFGGG